MGLCFDEGKINIFMEFTKGVTYYVKMKKGKIVDF